jgi:hypothetical protein
MTSPEQVFDLAQERALRAEDEANARERFQPAYRPSHLLIYLTCPVCETAEIMVRVRLGRKPGQCRVERAPAGGPRACACGQSEWVDTDRYALTVSAMAVEKAVEWWERNPTGADVWYVTGVRTWTEDEGENDG